MKTAVIARGAEAIIIKQGKTITKDRVEKSYRYPDLDKKIRKLRTRSEAKILEKTKYKVVCEQIGKQLAKLHDNDIIHGDLTTSNLILNKKEDKVYFIDFGLGFHSSRVEDKAVDLHLIKQALEAKHPTIHEQAYQAIVKGYKKSKNAKATLTQLEKVEKRGRYKEQY